MLREPAKEINKEILIKKPKNKKKYFNLFAEILKSQNNFK